MLDYSRKLMEWNIWIYEYQLTGSRMKTLTALAKKQSLLYSLGVLTLANPALCNPYPSPIREEGGIFKIYPEVDAQESMDLMIQGQPYRKISAVDRLKAEAVRFSGLISETLDFTIPENAVGFVIVCQGENLLNKYAIEKLLAPDNTVLTAFDANTAQDSSLNRQAYGFSRYRTMLVPNHPQLKLQPGIYKLTLRRKSPAPDENAKVDILIKKKLIPAIPDEILWGGIRINFVFSPQGRMQAEAAQLSAEFSKKIADAKTIFSKAQLMLMDVKFKSQEKGYSYHTKYPSDLEFDPIFSEPKERNEVNFYFVANETWKETLAVTSSIGGPNYLESDTRHGVLVLDKDSAFDGKSLAHEYGHHLGLQHNWEDKRFTDNSTANIMSYSPNALLSFSPEQRKVIFHHPGVPLYAPSQF